MHLILLFLGLVQFDLEAKAGPTCSLVELRLSGCLTILSLFVCRLGPVGLKTETNLNWLIIQGDCPLHVRDEVIDGTCGRFFTDEGLRVPESIII